jgi:CheY-like chemotaxis protein
VIRAVLLSPLDLSSELGDTVLFRRNVERLLASRAEDVQRLASSGRIDIVVVDSALPGAAGVVGVLRQDPATRATAIVALGRSEFGFGHLDLLEAGANAILPLPPGHDWDDRLTRLINVPVRATTRFPVDMAIEGGLLNGLCLSGRTLNLSVHEVGQDLRFSLEMPGAGGAVRGTGTVVRVAGENCFGVELTHVEGDGRVRIKRYVESHGPE